MIADNSSARILVVEDDPFNGPFTRELLRSAGFRSDLVTSAEDGFSLLKQSVDDCPDTILLDVNLPGMDGFELASILKAHPVFQYVPIIIFTVHDSLDHKIEGLERGGDDYLTKPYEPDELLARINAMLRIRKLYMNLRDERNKNRILSHAMDSSDRLSGLLGRSAKMRPICRMILDISASDSNVLIHGESGVGKEVVARAIHQESLRNKGPFVVVNCAAYAETLLQSELFGHEKGAFTGAVKSKKGRFEQADQGAIFLDEIGEVSLPTQVVLLRVIQEKCFERVGGERTISTDARVIAATNKNLRAAMNAGTFREDLFYRLNVISIEIPPLRERKEDIPGLVKNFVEKFNQRFNKTVAGFNADAMDLIFAYNWPGNVRQLENVVERSVVLCKHEMIRPDELPAELINIDKAVNRITEKSNLDNVERQHVKSVLDECCWNKYKAAQVMGISRSTLYSKMKKHNLVPPDDQNGGDSNSANKAQTL